MMLLLAPPSAEAAGQCAKLVVYSATWCPACTRMREDLNKTGVSFQELFVDKDKAADNMLAARSRIAGRKISYPTLEINSKVLPRNYYAKDLVSHFNVCLKN